MHTSVPPFWLPRVLSGLSSFVPEPEAAENPLGTSLKQISRLEVSDSGSGRGLSAASPASSGVVFLDHPLGVPGSSPAFAHTEGVFVFGFRRL